MGPVFLLFLPFRVFCALSFPPPLAEARQRNAKLQKKRDRAQSFFVFFTFAACLFLFFCFFAFSCFLRPQLPAVIGRCPAKEREAPEKPLERKWRKSTKKKEEGRRRKKESKK